MSLSYNARRRGGCNSKLEYSALATLLKGTKLVGEKQFEDATSLSVGHGLYSSIDTLLPFTSDPYIYGRVSVAHVITDLHSVGVEPTDCCASLVIGDDIDHAGTIAVLDGVADGLREHNICFGKGHTLRGDTTALTLSAIGWTPRSQPKACLGTEYALLLTKPLGVARSVFMQELDGTDPTESRAFESLLATHSTVLSRLRNAFQGTSDVTGFGLVGAAVVLGSRGFSVTIESTALPLCDPDALSLPAKCDTEQNIRSFADRVAFAAIPSLTISNAIYGAQISGPLLMLCSELDVADVVQEFRTAGLSSTTMVGHATRRDLPAVIIC